MLEIYKCIFVLNHIDIEANDIFIANIFGELSCRVKLINLLFVLKIYFFDLIEPCYVHFDVGIGDSISHFMADSHLDMRPWQVREVEVLRDTFLGARDRNHAYLLLATLVVDDSDLFRGGPDNQAKLVDDLSDSTLIWHVMEDFCLPSEPISGVDE